MDCFLIIHCIWSEEEQIEGEEDKIGIVKKFVSEAIEKHGYTKEIDFKSIRDELDNFITEIKEETKHVKDIRVEELEPVYNDYFEILNPPNQNSNLINQNEFKNLSNQNKGMYLYYWYDYYKRVERNSSYNIRKGNSTFSLFINDKEYKLKTTMRAEKQQVTHKPNEYTEKAWDERVNGFLQHTEDMKNQIEEYRKKDLEHLRTNLFVAPALANKVESHITETQKAIEKIELEIREIQNGYKKLKDEKVVLDD
jgi:hypothetical protein